MKSFKEFIDEKFVDYRTRPYNVKRNEMSIGQYDTDYFDKVPDVGYYRSDETGKPYAFRHKLIPKTKIASNAEDIIPTSDDVIHRGISHDEFQNIMKTGKIKSKGSGNLGSEQEGLTYFTTDPSAAQSYSNMFAMTNKRPTPEKPPYIISIKKPHESRIKKIEGTGEHEVGVTGEIPSSDIIGIYRGNVIDHTPSNYVPIYDKYTGKKVGKSGVSSMSHLHWEKIK